VGGFNNLTQLDPDTIKKIKEEYNKDNINDIQPNISLAFNSNFLATESAQLKKA
jgi:hypothetical protein